MKARQLFEHAGPAPVEAPPKPGVKPGVLPARPAAPQKFPEPWRRRDPSRKPGPLRKPKACAESNPENEKPSAVRDLLRSDFGKKLAKTPGVTVHQGDKNWEGNKLVGGSFKDRAKDLWRRARGKSIGESGAKAKSLFGR